MAYDPTDNFSVVDIFNPLSTHPLNNRKILHIAAVPGLVGGSMAYDLTGHNWNGTGHANGGSYTYVPSWTSLSNPGGMGSATVYAGYYSTSWTAALTDFTVSLWFCAQYVTPSGNSRIIDKSYSGGFWIGQNGSGTTDQWGGGIQQTSSPYGLFGSGFTMGQWWHLAMKRKGTTQTLYKNGYPIASQSCSGSSFDASPFYIFAPTSSTNNGYVGQLNALKIWDYALPDDLVGEDYAQEISGNPQIFNRISFMVPGVSAIVSGKVQRRHIGIPRTGTRIEPATGGAL